MIGNKVELDIAALLFMKVLASKSLDVAKQLSELEKVRNVFTTS